MSLVSEMNTTKLLLNLSTDVDMSNRVLERQGFITLEAKMDVLKKMGYTSKENTKTEETYWKLLEKLISDNMSLGNGSA